MPSNWTKQPQQLIGTRYFNSGAGTAVLGGAISSVPAGINISQGAQDIPGDKIIFGQADADAMSDPAVGDLYQGMYQYIRIATNPTAVATRTRLLFWDNAIEDNTYEVTPDENTHIAGVGIITLTDAYYGWMCIAGQVEAYFTSTLAVATNGSGVFAAMLGAGANVGTLTQYDGTYANATMQDVSEALARYMGQASELPVANTATVIEMPLGRVRF